MVRLLPIYLATVLVLGVGGWLGFRMGRWSPRADREAMLASARPEAIPLAIAGWTGERSEIDPKELQLARAPWSFAAGYRHPDHPGYISVMVLGGAPGPISVHTPDICFVGAGQSQLDPVQPLNVPDPSIGADCQFRTSRFANRGGVSQAIWSWSDGGPWIAPDYPRIHFASSGALYKLYVVRDPGPGAEAVPQPGVLDETTREFLAGLLPALRSALFPEPPATPPAPKGPKG